MALRYRYQYPQPHGEEGDEARRAGTRSHGPLPRAYGGFRDDPTSCLQLYLLDRIVEVTQSRHAAVSEGGAWLGYIFAIPSAPLS